MKLSFRAVAVAALPVLILGGVSFAYITAQGDGTGHAAQGTEAPTLQVGVVVPSVDFGKTGTVEVYVKNASTKVSYQPGAATVGKPVVTPVGDNLCPAGSFVLGDAVITLPDHALAPGETAKVATAPLAFVNLPDKKQTGCLGADVTVTAHVS